MKVVFGRRHSRPAIASRLQCQETPEHEQPDLPLPCGCNRHRIQRWLPAPRTHQCPGNSYRKPYLVNDRPALLVTDPSRVNPVGDPVLRPCRLVTDQRSSEVLRNTCPFALRLVTEPKWRLHLARVTLCPCQPTADQTTGPARCLDAAVSTHASPKISSPDLR